MSPFITVLINALVPILVDLAEKLFSRGDEKHGPKKHAWVTEMVTQELVPIFERKLPDFLKPEAAHLGRLIDEAIEKALVELGL